MDNELHIVTEVGTFGNLNIEDPTIKKIKKKKKKDGTECEETLDEIIQESIQINIDAIKNQ